MLRTFNVQELIEREVVPFGNGSIVYTPKKWLKQKVWVVLEEKQQDPTSEILALLKSHMPSIQGIFLYGSRARDETTNQSDVDLLVVSDQKLSLPKTAPFDIRVATKAELLTELPKDSTLFLYQLFREAVPIVNASLLKEFQEIKVNPNFRLFLDDTLRAFKQVHELLLGEQNNHGLPLKATSVIYSLILRLKTLYLIQCFLKKQSFSNQNFISFLTKKGISEENLGVVLKVYSAERADQKFNGFIPLSSAELLFETAKQVFLETEALVKK